MAQRYRAFRQSILVQEKMVPQRRIRGAVTPSHSKSTLCSLATLRALEEMLGKTGTPAGSFLEPFLGIYRNQIIVDEATDFSPIQLACMEALAHRRIRSFFACGDF